MWWSDPGLEVVFDPSARDAPAATVLVGLGDAGDPLRGDGVVLNFKGLGHGPAAQARSVSEFVALADDSALAAWRDRLPRGPASLRRVVVEDLSLDTCLALVVLFARLGAEGVPAFDVAAWTRYASRWESGHFDDTEPRRSVALLVTLLGHSYLAPPESRAQQADRFRAGFAACLALLDALLRDSPSPESPVLPRGLPACERALAQYDYEYQQYRLALVYGRRCQLRVPLASGGRRLLVDALILEEVEPGGILKVFARTDTEHTYGQRGFGLLAVYRPSQAGTGNDITVSVDPTLGLSLVDLWRELERRENEAWAGRRPAAAPRRLASYLGPDGAPVAGAPDEPWWDDSGRYTLLGAPKRVVVDGQAAPGTRLRWREDVLAAIWQQYSPVPADAVDVRVTAIGDRRFASVRWTAGSNLALAESPSFHGWLASCSMRTPVVSPSDLPDEDAYEVIRIAGGLVVLHRDGLTVFDDWRVARPDVDRLRTIAADVALASKKMRDFLATDPLQTALRRQQSLLGDDARADIAEFRRWREDYLRLKATLLGALTLGGDGATPHELAQLRFQIGRAWDLSDDRERMFQLFERVDATTRDAFATLKERRTRWFTALACSVGGALAFQKIAELLEKAHRRAPDAGWDLLGIALSVAGLVAGYLVWRKWGARLGGD